MSHECPRCGSLDCNDPDSKACSDNCITRHQEEIAKLTARLRAARDFIASIGKATCSYAAGNVDLFIASKADGE